MTMIGRYVLGDVGVLLGDLMLSSTIAPSKPISLPTAGFITAEIAERRFYSGLMQKVCILNDRLIVAWAGSLLSAKVVLRTLKETLATGDISLDSVKTALTAVAPEHFTDFQMIGLIKGRDCMESFVGNAYEFDPVGGVPGLKNCAVAGSGAGQLYNEFCVGTLDYANERNPVRRAVQYGHSVIGSMIGEEAVTKRNLERAFGGGYEMALFDANGPQKVGDILYLFWMWDKEETDSPGLVPLMIKADYIGTDLILQRIYSEPDHSGERMVIKDRRSYAVRTPLDDALTFEEMGYEKPTLTPYYLSCTYLCRNKGYGRVLTTCKTSRNKDSHVIVSEEQNGVFLRFNEAYRNRDLELVNNALAADPGWNS